MIIENLDGMVVLKADEGKRITNSTRRFFADFIYLGKNDSPDNYEEVGREIWKHFVKEENPDINELKARTDDLQSSVSSLQEETSALNETQLSQDETDDMLMMAISDSDEKHESLTDVMLCAIDEVFTMVEPLIDSLAEATSISTLSDDEDENVNKQIINKSVNKGVKKMVELYVVMVQRGLKKIEQVPARYREQVKELLNQVE